MNTNSGGIMITKEEFIKLLSWECEVLRKQIADITHAESLLQPQPGGNCMNWVVGHLVVNLVDILNVLGGEVPPELPDLTPYAFGSDPILCDAEDVIPLQALVDEYEQLTSLVSDQLNRMAEADFDEEIDFWQGKNQLGYVAFFYYFHHTYHLGQLEQLRNLAGKTEKVI
jgi:hypothetical protein